MESERRLVANPPIRAPGDRGPPEGVTVVFFGGREVRGASLELHLSWRESMSVNGRGGVRRAASAPGLLSVQPFCRMLLDFPRLFGKREVVSSVLGDHVGASGVG
jgi:hypothetical protein